jgi:hypothetical protein
VTVLVTIKDGTGSKREAKVDSRHALEVAVVIPDTPDEGAPNRLRYFSGLVGSTGTDSGVTSMNVDGSGTPAEFFIGSDPEFDIKITRAIIFIEDSNQSNKTFGFLTELSIGWDLKIEESGEETILIDKAKTNGEVLFQVSPPIFGTNDKALNNIGDTTGTNQGFLVDFDIEKAVPGGVRLGRGTQDKIVSVINDSLLGLTDFTVRLIGYRHFP